MWESSGFGPHNVQVAQAYDGYSFFVYCGSSASALPEGEAFRSSRTVASPSMGMRSTRSGDSWAKPDHGMGHIMEPPAGHVAGASARCPTSSFGGTVGFSARSGPPLHTNRVAAFASYGIDPTRHPDLLLAIGRGRPEKSETQPPREAQSSRR